MTRMCKSHPHMAVAAPQVNMFLTGFVQVLHWAGKT